MIKRIHPAFKNFIMNDALMKWDKFMKEDDPKSGIDAGTCFSTSHAFCTILNDNLEIPCKIEEVETTIGNPKARELFIQSLNEEKLGQFWKDMEKYKTEHTTLPPDGPVIVGMGHGDDPSQFHFIMNLYKHGEAVDLTLRRVQRPQWNISCNNYWAKYIKAGWNEGKKGRDFFVSHDIMRNSGCVMLSATKTTPAHICLDKEDYKREFNKLRDYIREQIIKRNIPVFMR